MTKLPIKNYLLNNLELTEIEDIVEHGCSGGVSGFIYYTETNAFHDEHEDEIWDMLYHDAEEEGMTICELIASFYGQKDVGSMQQFKNLLCWYAVEKIAAIIISEKEFNEDN